ncbi:1-acyl-sn-glycerol-3-phosphate acyltransferase [Methylocystis echinoides]|uniref:1-acyl-sn-glycerol-3-phosphate acyltransferase n=2 Tax=Methylocystis echinoides TaxID=29468 RepID=A0A9W6GUE1_9HYPH|nr:1-acyl-sn-glycerol-3-phosphate acyltransferase [Methylocystis echinoides]
MPYLRALAFLAAMTAAFLFLVPVQALARRRGWEMQHAIQKGFCRAICAVIGIRVETQGAPLPATAARFVVANHVSWTDIIALASVTPAVFLAKSEVAHWPALGFLARLQGTIFVPRGSRKDIPRVNADLCGTLRAGRDVIVFPEGTSSDGRGVLAFQPAHFEALRLLDGAAILAPAAIFYKDGAGPVDVGWYGEMTFLPHLWGLMKRGGVICRIAFGAPIPATGKDRKTLASDAETQVRQLHAALRA